MKADWIVVGACSGALAVVLGAFGAHGLADRLEVSELEVWSTAVHYQMFHALALLVVGVLARGAGAAGRARSLNGAGWAFAAGTVAFSGSLYALVLGGPRILGPVTPLGGAGLIAGWLLLAVAARGSGAPPGSG
ncbi:MAG: DUF423 domain-containing protein [Planctomycetota bacterium]|jgi:uncharacterized membrane protein YgdD (TMEM256/DUF423 family)|nr:DUF423 domain-containing protein [Planctomycetota bacterium]MDP6763662.1 DUF423 domain-containing protein [Planctomycetota bacterium]MDP6987931.1 DUF423 domain-containing protein [Planctomycetota bacterium]